MTGFKSCPVSSDDFGCILEQACYPDDEDCPEVFDSCQDDEIECELDGHLVCIPDTGDDNCPTLCPADCDEDEKACDGQPPTATACEGDPVCIRKYDEITGEITIDTY